MSVGHVASFNFPGQNGSLPSLGYLPEIGSDSRVTYCDLHIFTLVGFETEKASSKTPFLCLIFFVLDSLNGVEGVAPESVVIGECTELEKDRGNSIGGFQLRLWPSKYSSWKLFHVCI